MPTKLNLPFHPGRLLGFLPADAWQALQARGAAPDSGGGAPSSNVAQPGQDDPATIEHVHRALYATTRSRLARNRRGRIRDR
jgi:hypothetical protein